MKHRLMALIAVAAVSMTVATPALAFDCIRVSSSLQGLQQSASNSGMWESFDMSPTGSGVAQILDFFGISYTPAQLSCLQSAYTTAQASDPVLPTYFALGTGVAGGKTGNGPGVLAHNAPEKVLSNGTGIDHFDDTVLPVLLNAAPTCFA